MNSNSPSKLWPYRNATAFMFVPLIWLLLAIAMNLAGKALHWPGDESRKLVTQVIIAAGFVPLLLVLLDYLSSRGAILSYKDFKIDFSQVDLNRAELRRDAFGLPDNIGVSGPIISDTTPMDIIDTLKQATRHEIVVIDMRDGRAWWVTRLLALAAGAVRAQAPRVFVFVGQLENQEHRFLAWAHANDILTAILNSKTEYYRRYSRALRIAMQVTMYGYNEFVPALPIPPGSVPPGSVLLHPEVQRYTNDPRYASMGPEVTEQIVMDQLAARQGAVASLEEPPDRLTVGRLNDLFGHCLYRTEIDLAWPKDKQIARVLESNEPYIALVRNRRFESMLRREDGERLIARELYAQLHRTTKA